MMSRVRSAKRVSSAAKTAAEAFSKLCHVVREGERKQLLFPLSKMAEGREKAARSREEDPRSPSCSGEGWGDSARHLSPRFLLFNNALCPVSRLSVRTNDIQLCCQCTRGSTGPPCWGKAASRLWLPHCHSAAQGGVVHINVSSC